MKSPPPPNIETPAVAPATPLILAVDVTGAPRGWITWQDAVASKASGRVERELGDFHFTFYGGHSRLTGERSSISVSSILALRGRNPRGWEPLAPALTNALLFQRDRHLCCYCGSQKRPDLLTRDHIIPVSRGGADSWKNVVTACKPCNQRKGAKSPERVITPTFRYIVCRLRSLPHRASELNCSDTANLLRRRTGTRYDSGARVHWRQP